MNHISPNQIQAIEEGPNLRKDGDIQYVGEKYYIDVRCPYCGVLNYDVRFDLQEYDNQCCICDYFTCWFGCFVFSLKIPS